MLDELGVPTHLSRLSRNLYTDSKTVVKLDNTTSKPFEPFKLDRGVFYYQHCSIVWGIRLSSGKVLDGWSDSVRPQ